jgi:hypothetical protein
MIEEKELKEFFARLNNTERDILTVLEFENEVRKRQPNFTEPDNE